MMRNFRHFVRGYRSKNGRSAYLVAMAFENCAVLTLEDAADKVAIALDGGSQGR